MSLGYAKQLNRLEAEIKQLKAQRDELLVVLEKLAKLGNGDCYGNSVGNDIAKAALTKAKGDEQ